MEFNFKTPNSFSQKPFNDYLFEERMEIYFDILSNNENESKNKSKSKSKNKSNNTNEGHDNGDDEDDDDDDDDDDGIKSEPKLLKLLKEQFPNDTSVNLSRIERDFRVFVKDWDLTTQKRPIIAIKRWMKKHHVNTKMNYMLHHVEDFSKCDLGIFLKVESFQAAPLAETIRKVFEKNHCFVVSDYDTVLVHFGEKKKYEDFLNLCEEFIPNFSNQ